MRSHAHSAASQDADITPRKLQHIAAISSKSQQSVVLLGGWGFHNGLDARPIHESLIHPLAQRLGMYRHVQLICVGAHSVQEGSMQPQYLSKQNNEKVGTETCMLPP